RRVPLYSWAQVPGVVASANVSVGLGSQASVAVGLANTSGAGHSTFVGPGTSLIAGAVSSDTLIVWLFCELLPQWSVAVHVRVTLYSWAHVPGVVASANVSAGFGSQTSLAVGSANTSGAGHSTFVGAGTSLIAGAVSSDTLIVWLFCELLPQWSVAVHVRVTLYSWAQVPGVVASADVSVGLAVQLSEAVGVAKFSVPGHS